MKFYLLLFIMAYQSIAIFCQNSNDKAKEMYFKALELHESKSYAESNKMLNDAQMTLASNNPTIQYLRIKNFYALKDYDQTMKEIAEYIKLNPIKDEAYTEVQKYKNEIEQKQAKENDTNAKKSDENNNVLIVEKMPSFPGGDVALVNFLSENVRYPVNAQNAGVEGRVICEFVVNTDGSIVNIEVLRSVHPDLDNEAKRVIKSMPKWQPATAKGKPVRVKYTMPINFRLK